MGGEKKTWTGAEREFDELVTRLKTLRMINFALTVDSKRRDDVAGLLGDVNEFLSAAVACVEHMAEDRHSAAFYKETPIAAWDRRVVADARQFVVMKIRPRVMRCREEHKFFDEAVRSAETWNDPHGRRALIYAVDGNGRSVHILENDWPKYKGKVASGPVTGMAVVG